jgi:hypothetical protein
MVLSCIPDSGKSWARPGWGWTPDPRQIVGGGGGDGDYRGVPDSRWTPDPRRSDSPANRGWDPHPRSPANRGWGWGWGWGSGVPCPALGLAGQVRSGQVRFTRSPVHTASGSPQTLGARDSEPTTGVDRGGLRGSPGKIRRHVQSTSGGEVLRRWCKM